MRYRQVIHVDHHADDLLKLPCVTACIKQKDGKYCYHVRKGDTADRWTAFEGDFLCERYDGVREVRKRKEKIQGSTGLTVEDIYDPPLRQK